MIGGLVVVGNPVHRVDHAWHSFKGGYEDNTGSSNRLTAGLGSNRYDFYRVALNVFADHPVAGVGADNFFQDYLRARQLQRDAQVPAQPRAADAGADRADRRAAAVRRARRGAGRRVARDARRGRDPLAAAVAGGATMAFFYWVAHGMTDWFWEWAGLGAPAFAFLGLACALAPRARRRSARRPRPPRRAPRLARAPLLLAGAGVLLLAAAVVLAGPWLAQRDVDAAAKVYASRPFEAYSRLDRAARLDPLSDQPALIKGSIALRYGDLPRARAAFQDGAGPQPARPVRDARARRDRVGRRATGRPRCGCWTARRRSRRATRTRARRRGSRAPGTS